jgi:hypothetical protein
VATGAMAMEPPPQPPGVQAQMGGGAPPFAGVGAMMGEKAQAGNPVKSALDMTEKMWANVAKANPKMAPYVDRALAILKQGVTESAGQGNGPAQGPAPVPQGPPPGNIPG